MTQLPQGWVTLRSTSTRRLLWSAPPPGRLSLGFLVVILGLQFVIRAVLSWVFDTNGWPGVIVLLVALALAIISVYLFRSPGSEWARLNFDESLVRDGRVKTPFDQITDATFMTMQHRGHIDSYLGFGASVEKSTYVRVKSPHLPELDEASRELVAEVLRRSPIRIPEPVADKYDPTGKFGWMDHPNSLSKDEAIEFVLHTPESGEPVRAPERPKSIRVDED
ncbi:hypothetical protein GCM10027413_09350 [Conyzicola nivalis]|uniref:Uncharacterized protein n=1 Tax=Conyzicola nivalis TaxID=1477021 RepID=A0A916WJA3_9MICO|nr:hypothetical protein [Conyzicola nivalis]GGB03175.1 hypothetical protein GCM10010979_17280 [Conyzicola nivalis]